MRINCLAQHWQPGSEEQNVELSTSLVFLSFALKRSRARFFPLHVTSPVASLVYHFDKKYQFPTFSMLFFLCWSRVPLASASQNVVKEVFRRICVGTKISCSISFRSLTKLVKLNGSRANSWTAYYIFLCFSRSSCKLTRSLWWIVSETLRETKDVLQFYWIYICINLRRRAGD